VSTQIRQLVYTGMVANGDTASLADASGQRFGATPNECAGLGSLTFYINLNSIAGTLPSIQFFIESRAADGVWYPISSASVLGVLSAIGSQATAVGLGTVNSWDVGTQVRVRWAILGTLPVMGFTINVYATST
jgi:hypothetical protein